MASSVAMIESVAHWLLAQTWQLDQAVRLIAVGLVAVLDWFSRCWELNQTLEMPFVLAAVDGAIVRSTPTICNSD